jgi:hypothetical protein
MNTLPVFIATSVVIVFVFWTEIRISWIGHVERVEDSRMPKTVMGKKVYARRKRGRPKVRWLDDGQEDLREMGIEGLRRKAQDRDQWRRIAQEAKTHVGL